VIHNSAAQAFGLYHGTGGLYSCLPSPPAPLPGGEGGGSTLWGMCEIESEKRALEARGFLGAHKAGTLEFDENYVPWKFVVDPADGRLCGPVMVAALLSSQHVLHLPEETDDPGAMRVLLSPEQLDDDPPIADRWMAYHGEPEDVRWAAFWLDFAKWDGMVVDGDAFMREHPFRSEEGKLVKGLNADVDRLRRLCVEVGGMRDVESPMAVGVDSLGVDVRARFDIVRLPFPEEATDAETAMEMLAGLGA